MTDLQILARMIMNNTKDADYMTKDQLLHCITTIRILLGAFAPED